MGFNPLSTTKTERQWVKTHWKKSKNFTLTKYSCFDFQLKNLHNFVSVQKTMEGG